MSWGWESRLQSQLCRDPRDPGEELGKYYFLRVSTLFIFSKNQLLVLLIFTIVSFISFSFISAQIFMISFLLLTLGFFCSSSSCFR